MSRISDILLRARDSLSDPKGQRWSDDRLLRLLDEAQKDIVRRAKLLRAKTTIYVIEGQHEYKLPDDVLAITRVLVDDHKVDFINHEELDEVNPTWEIEQGSIKNIVIDRRNRHIIKTYRIPIDVVKLSTYSFVNAGYLEDITYLANSDYGILVDGEESDSFTSTCPLDDACGVTVDGKLLVDVYDADGNYIVQVEYDFDFQNGDYGLVGAITDLSKDVGVRDSTYGFVSDLTDFEFISDYGIVTDIQDDDMDIENFNSEVGTITEITESESKLIVYYVKKPNTIASIYDELEIDSSFDAALKYYIVGKALRDDMDTMNRQVGNEELQFYTRELAEAVKDDMHDFVRTGKNLEIQYTGAF